MAIYGKAGVSPDELALDPETERAARAFPQRLEGKYPVIEAIVFGSRARGDHVRHPAEGEVAYAY